MIVSAVLSDEYGLVHRGVAQLVDDSLEVVLIEPAVF